MEHKAKSRLEEIELFCILRLLVKKAWLILMAALIGAMAAAVVLTTAVSQTYSTSVTFAVLSRAVLPVRKAILPVSEPFSHLPQS